MDSRSAREGIMIASQGLSFASALFFTIATTAAPSTKPQVATPHPSVMAQIIHKSCSTGVDTWLAEQERNGPIKAYMVIDGPTGARRFVSRDEFRSVTIGQCEAHERAGYGCGKSKHASSRSRSKTCRAFEQASATWSFLALESGNLIEFSIYIFSM